MQQANPTADWQERYLNQDTPWDLGQASPPLTAFLQNWTHKEAEILIPGGGRSYEAIWAWENGFERLYSLDIAKAPQKALCAVYPERVNHILIENFFEHKGRYDLILEQTFFCALPPRLREAYVQKMYELLKPGARLTGVLFDFPLTEKGPPYGGSKAEYLDLFLPHFRIQHLERCYNSVPARQNKELFFQVIKA